MEAQLSSPTIIALSGSIGAGKTTAGRDLVALCGQNAKFYEEQLPDYVCKLLAKSNDDPLRWMELFQAVMVTRAAMREQEVSRSGIAFVERPLEESWVFGNANLAIGRLSLEFYRDVYAKLHAEYKSGLRYALIVFFYVREETAAQRRAVRGRPAEDRYGEAYTNALTDAYFEWVLECCAEGRMLVVDWNEFQPTRTLLSAVVRALAKPEALRFSMPPPRGIEDLAQRRQYQNEVLSSIAAQHAA